MLVSNIRKESLRRLVGHSIGCTKLLAPSVSLAFVVSLVVDAKAKAQTLPVIPTLDSSAVAIAQLDSSCIARVVSLDNVPACRSVLQQYKNNHNNKKQILDKYCWDLDILDLATRSEYALKGWVLGISYDKWAAQVRNRKAFLCASSSRTRQNHRNAIWDFTYYYRVLRDKESSLKYSSQFDGIRSPVIQ
jgi:hypothetical protein